MAKVVVVGPGALGALFAVRLAQAGHDVVVGCKDAATVKNLAEQGVILEDRKGKHTAKLPAVARARDLPWVPDLVILAVKTGAAVTVAKDWDVAPLLSLQNGVTGDALASSVNDYIAGTVGFPAAYVKSGHSQQSAPGEIHIGRWPSGVDSTVNMAARIVSCVEPVKVQQNMQGVAWTKLIINSAGNGVGTMAGQGLGDLLRNRWARQAFIDVALEGRAVGLASGIEFETVTRFHPDVVGKIGRVLGRPGQHLLMHLVGRKYRNMRSSSLQGLDRGLKTDVDFLNGFIAKQGKELGIATPVNDAITALIHRIENGEIKPGPALVDGLYE